MSSSERDILEEYVREGKIMQVATVNSAGEPALCHVWFQAAFMPDVLHFLSGTHRDHSHNIAATGTVAGGIIHHAPEQLGEKGRGVAFRGHAREVPVDDLAGPLDEYLARWPQASKNISVDQIVADTTHTRLYEITVAEWTLYDEVNFPDNAKRVILGK